MPSPQTIYRNNTVMGASGPQRSMFLKGQAVLLHDPENTLGIDDRLALVAPLPIQQCRHQSLAIGRPQFGEEREVMRLPISAPRLATLIRALDQVGPRDAQDLGNGAQWEPSFGSLHEGSSDDRFFLGARSSASLRISASIVFLPSMRSRSRTRFSNSRTWEAATTSSSALRQHAPLKHSALPGKELGGSDAGTACNIGNAHARLHGFLHQADFLRH
jgi:hypothetical protein